MSDDNGRIGISPDVYDAQISIMNERAASLSTLIGNMITVLPFVGGSRGSVGPVASRMVDVALELGNCAATMEKIISASVIHLESIRDDIVEADESGGQ